MVFTGCHDFMSCCHALLGAAFLAYKAKDLHGSVWEILGVGQEGFRQWRSYLAIGIPSTFQLCGEWRLEPRG